MDESEVMLLYQLAGNLKENLDLFTKSFESSDKESFEKSKKALLEIQSKINFILGAKAR